MALPKMRCNEKALIIKRELIFMDVFETILNRRSIRKFKKDALDDKLIGVMLHMATQAPSAGNLQDSEFVVVKDEDVKKRIAEAALRQMFVAEAPVAIVVCADLEKAALKYHERGERLYTIQDTSFAVMNMLLAAQGLGLATCVVNAFDEEEVKKILSLPVNLRPLAIIPVGYSDEEPVRPERIPFENLTSVDRYGKKYDISQSVQIGPGRKLLIKPLGNELEAALKKRKKGRKFSFEELLKKLSK